MSKTSVEHDDHRRFSQHRQIVIYDTCANVTIFFGSFPMPARILLSKDHNPLTKGIRIH